MAPSKRKQQHLMSDDSEASTIRVERQTDGVKVIVFINPEDALPTDRELSFSEEDLGDDEAMSGADDTINWSSRDSTVDSLDGFDVDEAQWSDNDTLFSSDCEEGRPIINEDAIILRARRTREEIEPAPTEPRNRYLKLIRDRLGAFTEELAREAGGMGVLNGYTIEHTSLHTMIHQIIFTMDRRILFAIMRGDLPRQQRLKKNKKLRRALHIHKQNGSQTNYKHCIIYAYYLANAKSGHPPTVAQMRTIVSTLKIYIARDVTDPDDLALIHRVDNQMPGRSGERPTREAIAVGHRRYLVPEGTNKKPSIKRPLAIETLINRIEEQIEEVSRHEDHDDRDPMPRTLCEFGLTGNADKRHRDHEAHHNTNSTMALFDAICKARWPALNLGMQRFVVYCASAPVLAPVAEHLLSCIGGSYFNTGGGFNTHEAGLSASCVNAVSTSDADKCFEWTESNIDVEGNKEYFLSQDRAYVAAGDSVRRKTEAEIIARDAAKAQLAALCAEAAELDLDDDPEMKEELFGMIERIREEHGFES